MMTKTMAYTFEAKNGLVVRVRPLLPEDAPYLVDLFEHMSADSRYRRFHQPLDNVAPERVWEEAESIARNDPALQVGFIAFADLPGEPDAPVGAARFVLIGDGVGEAAVSVRDDMQSQGLGTLLLTQLAAEARERGVEKLAATIQNSNKAIIRILNRLPYPLSRTRIGPDSELVLDLAAPQSL